MVPNFLEDQVIQLGQDFHFDPVLQAVLVVHHCLLLQTALLFPEHPDFRVDR